MAPTSPLIERRPGARIAFELLPVRAIEPLRPQILADAAAERIIGAIALRRQTHHVPDLAVAAKQRAGFADPAFGQDGAGEIILVPAGLDQDDPTARQQPGLQVVLIGLARLTSDQLGIGVLATFDGIVDGVA
jgi:hypothetical protein